MGRWEYNDHCMDCYRDTFDNIHDYSVHDDVWIKAVPGWVGQLCLYCLRRRLQRNLKMDDFMHQYSVNDHIVQKFLDRVNSHFRL